MLSSISSYACVSAADLAWKVIESKNETRDENLQKESQDVSLINVYAKSKHDQDW
jgi:hypothetical protein